MRVVLFIPVLFGLAFWFMTVEGYKHHESSIRAQGIIHLDTSNLTLARQGEWLILCFADWCPASRRIRNPWETFATRIHEDPQKKWLHVAQINVDEDKQAMVRLVINYYPTIFYIRDGVMHELELTQFDSLDHLMEFTEKEDRTEGLKQLSYPLGYQPLSIFGRIFGLLGILVNVAIKVDNHGREFQAAHNLPDAFLYAAYVGVFLGGMFCVIFATIFLTVVVDGLCGLLFSFSYQRKEELPTTKPLHDVFKSEQSLFLKNVQYLPSNFAEYEYERVEMGRYGP